MCVEPLRGWRPAEVTARRKAKDFAACMQELVDIHVPDVTVISVMLDHLNTHSPSALYVSFPLAEPCRTSRKLNFHYTPKHGRWLNMAAMELAVLSAQCLDQHLQAAEKLSF